MDSDINWLGREIKYKISSYFLWLSVKKGLPKELSKGSYSSIKLLRFSLVIFALLNFSAVALGSPNWNVATPYSLWLGLASAIYILVAVIYLLGLRMWYGPVTAVLVISAITNYAFDATGGPDALSLSASPNLLFNDAVAVTWLFLVVAGIFAMRYDRGSKLNELLSQS